MPLTDDDLAYMRETQAEHRPTEAQLVRQDKGRDALGGKTKTPAPEDSPVAIRISGPGDRVPAALADFAPGELVRITADLVVLRKDDVLKVSATEQYRIVSEGGADPATTWTTAQQLWAVRTKFPEANPT